MIYILAGSQPANIPTVKQMKYADALWSLQLMMDEAKEKQKAIKR